MKIKIILPVITFTLFFAIFTFLSLKLYDNYQDRGDLTNFTQAMWNTIHNRLMQNTFNYSVNNFWGNNDSLIPDNSNILGIHFNLILFIIVPIYLLFPYPQTLLVVQAFSVALCGLLVYYLSSKILKNYIVSLILELAFLIYFPVISAVLYDFHASTLSLALALFMILGAFYLNLFYYIIFFSAYLLVQENMSIPAFFFGFFLLFNEKSKTKGLITIILSLFYFIAVTKVVIPSLSNYKSFTFAGAYGNPLGGNIEQMAVNSFKNPALFFYTFFNKANLIYLKSLLMPLFPFILFSPVMLLVSLSSILPNLISSSDALKSFTIHYQAVAAPFLFFALILGVKNSSKYFSDKYKKTFITISGLLILTVTLYYFLRSGFLQLKNKYYQTQKGKTNKQLNSLVSKISDNASVSTQDYISTHLANRTRLYLFPVYMDKADYVLVSTDDQTWPLTNKQAKEYINMLIKKKKYKIIQSSQSFVLLKKSI